MHQFKIQVLAGHGRGHGSDQLIGQLFPVTDTSRHKQDGHDFSGGATVTLGSQQRWQEVTAHNGSSPTYEWFGGGVVVQDDCGRRWRGIKVSMELVFG